MKLDTKSTDGKTLNKLLKNLKNVSVNVGVLTGSGKHDDSQMSVAEVGFIHEFGTVTISERSFIREPINSNSKDIKTLTGKQYKKVLNGEITAEKGIGLVGAFTVGVIQKSFTSNNWKANSDATIANKGSSKPLIDTGQLRQSIAWEINKNVK
jgi:hypothetical protein